jgi:hypothetical protein
MIWCRLILAALALAAGSACTSTPDYSPASTPDYSTPTTADLSLPGFRVDGSADPGVGATTAERCTAVMPDATSQDISDCVLMYELMKK